MTLVSNQPSPNRRKSRLLCGAKTRVGGCCQVRAEPGKARCRFHGGKSTGPKTEAGRSRIAEAQRLRWRAYRESKLSRYALFTSVTSTPALLPPRIITSFVAIEEEPAVAFVEFETKPGNATQRRSDRSGIG